MAPFIAMALGSVVRTALATIGGGTVVAAATSPASSELQAAIGALCVAVAQLWSLYQKSKHADSKAPVEERSVG